MQSGCPQSQRGISSAIQHWSNLGALPSPRDINFASVPGFQPENEIMSNMVVAQYTWEYRAPSSPVKLQQSRYEQSPPNFQEPHQLESHTSTVSAGFHQPIPGDSAATTWNSCHQISNSSAHVTAQRICYFGTTASENSVNNSGQPREMSKPHFSMHGSNLNNNTGLQRRQELNCAGTGYVALQGDSLKVKAKTFTLHDQCSSVPVSKLQQYPHLLTALLTENTSDLTSFLPPSTSSEETNANLELYNNNNNANLSDERHYNGQQLKESLAALNRGQYRTQNGVIHSGRTPSNLHQQKISSPCLSSQSSTDQVLPVGKTHPDIDFQIQEFVAKRIACFRAVLNHSANDGSLMPNVAHPPTTFASDKDDDVERLNSSVNWAVKQQNIVAVEKALREESSKGHKGNAGLTTKSKKTDDCAPSASEKHSTENPQIMMEVAATCMENEDECPVVLTAVLKSSSKASENKTFELGSLIKNQDSNTKRKNLYQQDRSVTCKTFIAPFKLDPSVDKIQIHNIISVPTNQTSHEGVRKDAVSVCPQTDLSIALSANKIKKHVLSKSKCEEALCGKVVQLPQYEDISDEDSPQLGTEPPNTEQKEVSFPACSEDPLYEDLTSEDEHEVLSFRACSEDPKYEDITSEEESSQIKHVAESSTKLHEPNDKQSPFENEAFKHMQGRAQVKTGIISDEELVPKKSVSPMISTLNLAQHCSCLCLVETAGGFVCPKCDSESQTANSVSCGPSSVLKDDDTTDDETDDEWLFIPISIASLTFEPEDEDQESVEKNVLDGGETGDQERHWYDTGPTRWPSSDLVLETFDTVDSFQEAFKIRNIVKLDSGRSTPEHEMDSEGEPDIGENRKESEDSSETEDSCDYSSASENNYLTVSSKLLMRKEAPLPSETDDSVSEIEGEGVDVTNMQKGQTKSVDKLGNHVQPKAKILIRNSDTADGSDQSCKRKAERKKKAKRKRQSSSDPEDSNDDQCSKLNRHVPETVDISCGPVNSPFEDIILDDCSKPSHSAEERWIETIAISETNRQKISDNERVIIISSGTDDSDQDYKMPSRKRLFSSRSDSTDGPSFEQNGSPAECVDWEYGTAAKRLQETRLYSLPQHHSKLHDAQFKEVKQDACSDLSLSTDISGQLIETKGSSEPVQHKTEGTLKRREVVCDSIKVVRKKSHSSQEKAKSKTILSSGSEDSDEYFVATKNRFSTDTLDSVCQTTKMPQKNRQSSEHLPVKPPRFVETNSTLGPNPVIPRFIVVKPSQPKKSLKLFKENMVHRKEKGEAQPQKTSTASSKKADSLEKNKPYYKNNEGRSVHSLKPATKNSDQAIVAKSRMVSGPDVPRSECPSTSLSSRSGQLSEARQSSASWSDMSHSEETSASTNLSASKQSTSIPRQNASSKVQRPHSNSNPSASKHPSTKGPLFSATMQTSARTKVGEGWKNAHVPTRLERKSSLNMEEDSRTKHDLWREARPGPSHRDSAPRQRYSESATPPMRRQNSHESETPLMKKAKINAIQWTKAIHRDAPEKQRRSVGKGYKWSEGKANKRFR